MISSDSVRMAVGLSKGGPTGVYAELRTLLGSSIQTYRSNRSIRDWALRETEAWAADSDNQIVLSRFINGTASAPNGDSLQPLVYQFVENEKRYWSKTAIELGGLFDVQFIPYIADVLRVPGDELKKLHARISGRPDLLTKSEKQLGKEGAKLTEKAFLAAMLLRGYYRDIYARQGQILHHPYRSAFLAVSSNEIPTCEFVTTNTTRAAAAMLIQASMRQSTSQARIRHYAEAIAILRSAAKKGRLNLREADDDSIALSDSADALIKLGIRTRRPSADKWVDIFFGSAVTWATTFTLTPWESLAVGVASSGIAGAVGLGSVVGTLALERRYRLSGLGRATLGRLQRR
jgi:hypothetical protein